MKDIVSVFFLVIGSHLFLDSIGPFLKSFAIGPKTGPLLALHELEIGNKMRDNNQTLR